MKNLKLCLLFTALVTPACILSFAPHRTPRKIQKTSRKTVANKVTINAGSKKLS